MKDGGPAFPFADTKFDAEGTRITPTSGMSMRDYFAAKAMQGLLANTVDMSFDTFHALCYKHADAMLAEREK